MTCSIGNDNAAQEDRIRNRRPEAEIIFTWFSHSLSLWYSLLSVSLYVLHCLTLFHSLFSVSVPLSLSLSVSLCLSLSLFHSFTLSLFHSFSFSFFIMCFLSLATFCTSFETKIFFTLFLSLSIALVSDQKHQLTRNSYEQVALW